MDRPWYELPRDLLAFSPDPAGPIFGAASIAGARRFGAAQAPSPAKATAAGQAASPADNLAAANAPTGVFNALPPTPNGADTGATADPPADAVPPSPAPVIIADPPTVLPPVKKPVPPKVVVKPPVIVAPAPEQLPPVIVPSPPPPVIIVKKSPPPKVVVHPPPPKVVKAPPPTVVVPNAPAPVVLPPADPPALPPALPPVTAVPPVAKVIPPVAKKLPPPAKKLRPPPAKKVPAKHPPPILKHPPPAFPPPKPKAFPPPPTTPGAANAGPPFHAPPPSFPPPSPFLSPPFAAPAPSAAPSTGSGVSTAVIAGAAVGGVVVFAAAVAVLFACFYFFLKPKKHDGYSDYESGMRASNEYYAMKGYQSSGMYSDRPPSGFTHSYYNGPGHYSGNSNSNRSDPNMLAAGSAAGSLAYSATPNKIYPGGGGSQVGGGMAMGQSNSMFSYEELHAATGGFQQVNKLGEGGFGKVYKGVLRDGREVAVKVLTVGGGQGEREFQAEVETISRVHHRFLVTLFGYCIANEQRLLVYDFVPNGTLDSALHDKKRSVLAWSIRMKAAIGSAKGLAYLHEDCHPRIIHRDIKSSNILLDAEYEAQVADFGLAKSTTEGATHVSTRVMGTFGYLAPEYALSGKLTSASDVFSFGVVLLELIAGRRPVDTSQPPGKESLVEWARPLLTANDLASLVDPRLGERFDKAEMARMVNAAALCVRHSANLRPKMGQVVRMLQGESELDNSSSLPAGASTIHSAVVPFGGKTQDFDSALYSAEMRRQYQFDGASGDFGSSRSGGVGGGAGAAAGGGAATGGVGEYEESAGGHPSGSSAGSSSREHQWQQQANWSGYASTAGYSSGAMPVGMPPPPPPGPSSGIYEGGSSFMAARNGRLETIESGPDDSEPESSRELRGSGRRS